VFRAPPKRFEWPRKAFAGVYGARS
jgi:hypothetical protein